jgi:hypothetical protein
MTIAADTANLDFCITMTPLDRRSLEAGTPPVAAASVSLRVRAGDSIALLEMQPRRMCEDWHPGTKEVAKNL